MKTKYKKDILSLEELQKRIKYDKTTGEFTWVYSKKSNFIGKVAGTISVRGYVHIQILGNMYKGHRLAWLFVYGKWPEYGIDHVNGNKADNRIDNLRDISQRENNCNTPKHRDGKLPGYMLTVNVDGTKVYRARIITGKKSTFLGNFYTEIEAHQAYLKAREALKAK